MAQTNGGTEVEKSKARFGRVITAMATPFDPSGAVDFNAAAHLARHLVNHGSDGLVISGTTGESPTITDNEKIALFREIKTAVGDRAQVIAGTGSNNTHEVVALSKAAEELWVDALLVVCPYYNRPSQEGMYQHFRAVAEAVSIPVILYNVPARTAVSIDPATVLRLAEIDNIVAIKDAGKNLEQTSEIVAGAPAGFEVYSGDDSHTLPMLAVGAVGVVSVTSHVIGDDLKSMIDAFFAGDTVCARQLHLKALDLTRSIFSVPSPAPTKAALVMLDVLKSAHVRLPLVEPNEKELANIRKSLIDYGLLSS